jgi:VWFA-related protein
MKRKVLLLTFFSVFLSLTVVRSNQLSPTGPLTRPIIVLEPEWKEPPKEVGWAGHYFKMKVNVYNCTGLAIDSMRLHMSAPNKSLMDAGKTEETLFTRFNSFDADTSQFYNITLDSLEVASENPGYKLKTLSVLMKKLESAITNDPKYPHHSFNVIVDIDSIRDTHALIFEFELQTPDGEYIAGTHNPQKVQIVQAPVFSIKKSADKNVYAPGETGNFSIKCTNRQATDIGDLEITDDFPKTPKLVTLNSTPAPDSVIDLEYFWHIPLLKSKETKSYRINFANRYLRKDLLRSDLKNYAAPVMATNYCHARWGAIDSTHFTTIRIQAEPDLTPVIWEDIPGTTLSPGVPSFFAGVAKNIGGGSVEKPFTAKFYWAGPENPHQRNFIDSVRFTQFNAEKNINDPLQPMKFDSVQYWFQWDTPHTIGKYRIFMVVDSLNEVEELHDVYLAGRMAPEDSVYLYNNTFFRDVYVGIDTLHVNITHISLTDVVTQGSETLNGGFPSYVIAYVTVTDQNHRYISGLADTTAWLSQSDSIKTFQTTVDFLWQPLLEYHRADTLRPADRDIYHTHNPDFKITEVHKTTLLPGGGECFSTALVMDYSGSMGELDKAGAEKAAMAFVSEMRAGDQASVIKFGSTVEVVQRLTSDTTLIKSKIQAESPVSGGTAMLDGIYQGIAELSRVTGRRIVIAYTDGGDNRSSVGLDEAIQYARRLGIAVYTIGYGQLINPENLKNIATRTGGEYYESSAWVDIERIYKKIAHTVQNFYILAYKSTDENFYDYINWRTAKIGVDFFGMAADADTAHYRPPIQGLDLWIEETSFPDSSVNTPSPDEVLLGKYALPGETISYVLTYGNAGVDGATGVRVTKFLPDAVERPLNISPQPTTTTDSTLIWNLGELSSGAIGIISFDLLVKSNLPDYEIPLYDSVRIETTSNEDNLANNSAIDTVIVLPVAYGDYVFSPPQITATPAEIFALEPDTFIVAVGSALKWWNIWITDPEGVTDKTVYSATIDSFRQAHLPLMPDTLTVLPSFFDTRIPAEEDAVYYKVCLEYQEIFSQKINVVCDSFRVMSNQFRPDLVPRLDRLERSKPRSPGQPITISGTIKNIGGLALTAQDEFAASIFYRNLSLAPDSRYHLDKQLLAGPLLSFEKDSILINTLTWTPPDTGVYEILLVADADSQISEAHDVDPSFPENNLSVQIVTVRYEPPEVQITHLLTSGRIEYPDFNTLHFPENIASIVTVTDQNNIPIPGLADTSSWRKPGEVTNVNLPFEAIWTPLQEFRRGQPAHPANPDLSPSIRITEILRTVNSTNSAFATGQNPFQSFRAKIALLLDYSANMTSFQTRVEETAIELFHQLLPEDSVMVMPFAEQYTIAQNFTNDTQILSQLTSPSATTTPNYRLGDAINQAAQIMLGEGGRKYILVFSAGGNETSLHEQAATLEFALKSGTPVFIFNCGNDTTLAAISRGTGGKFYHLPEWGSLNAMAADFVKRLNHFYLALHTSPDPTLDGNWRTVALAVQYAEKSGVDQNHYLAPLDGFDGWVQVESLPDSVSEFVKLAQAGETVRYTLTYGNNGYQTGTQIRLRNVLPDSVTGPLNASVAPSLVNGRELIWELGDLAFGECGSIQFETRVNPAMPPFWFWLVDSVQLQSPNVADRVLKNNLAIDTVLVQPDAWSEPVIVADPAEVAVNEPVTLSITTQTPLKIWNIQIEYPVASAQGVDATGFNGQIQNRTEPLMPMAPDVFLKIAPDFTNTKIWDTQGSGEKRETYRAILEYTDWFDRPGTAMTTFTVFAKYELWLGQNKFNPDTDAPLEINFLSVIDQPIRIKIYNVAGELVQTVLDKFTPAGQHTLAWNGRDQNDRIVGSDVYVIILEAGAYKEWRKVVVVR